jgi:hypothetical protein
MRRRCRRAGGGRCGSGQRRPIRAAEKNPVGGERLKHREMGELAGIAAAEIAATL